MAKDIKDNGYTVSESKGIGSVKIADEVVCVIAALAVTEIDGVDNIAGTINSTNVCKVGAKALSKGIKVEIGEESVKVFVTVELKYGFSIPEVSAKIQDRVSTSIKNMTGLATEEVNIKVAAVKVEK